MQNFPLQDGISEDPAAIESLAAMSAFSGPALLQKVTDWLFTQAQTLDAAGVVIGDIHGPFSDQIKVRAISGVDGFKLERYPLLGMPCLDVIRSEDPYQVHINLASLEDDNLFAQFGVHEYIGHPLRNPYGRPIGVLCILARQLTDDQRSRLDQNLGWFAPRVSKELSTLRRDEMIRTTSNWLGQSNTEAVLRELCMASASALQTSTAFVLSKTNSHDVTRVRMLAHGGQIREDYLGLDLSRDPGPLASVSTPETVFHQSGVTNRFPDSKLATLLGVDSYLAIPLLDPNTEVLGYIGWAHQGKMSEILPLEETLEVFRAAATAELLRERQIAERKRMLDALQTKDRLESLGLMAGAIAHDFNNLLVSIIGNTNLAMDLVSTQAAQYLERVEHASVKAGDIVNQLLAYAGQHKDELSLSNLNDVVNQVIELLDLQDHPEVTVHRELSPEVAPVWVDSTQLQQAIMNLILNAQESFDNSSGKIVLRSSVRSLQAQDLKDMRHGYEASAGEFVVFEVFDDGCGMTSEIIERMFDPFYTSKKHGQGLGLATLLGFAKAHRGAIDVRSVVAVGTHISLFLPRAKPSSQPQTEPTSTRPVRSILPHLPILVVDDEEGVRTVVQRLLESLDYQVEVTSSGQEAIERLQDGRRYAMAVIDISMPGLNGWETLEAIREFQPDLPVIMMSGYTDEQSAAQEATQYNAQFLPKPFRRQDLQALVAANTRAD